MKKFKKLSSLLVCLLLLPMLTVHAEEPQVENKFVIEADESVTSKADVNGSGVYAGNNVTFENNIDGIGILAGNNVTFKGKAEYGLLAGNNINVNGNIEKEGFIFGNIINFDKDFVGNRDVFVFGNTVTLNGTITRDVTVFASQVIVKGKVQGNVTISTDKLEVAKEAEIVGTLKYNEDAKVDIASGATIAKTETTKALVRAYSFQERVWNFVVNYAGMLVLFLVLGLILPGLFTRIEKKTKDFSLASVFSTLGYGLLLLFFVPILFVVFSTLVFGLPLALLLLALYVVVICLSTIFTGYLLGLLIWKLLIKKDFNVLLVGLVGITALMALQSIPVVGTIIAFLSILITLGLVICLFKKDEE